MDCAAGRPSEVPRLREGVLLVNTKHAHVAGLAACAACLALVAARSHKADVPLDQVPDVVVHAAEKAVTGITLSEAKMRTKKSGVVFKLEGTADHKGYEIKVDAAGTVLDVEEGPAAGGVTRATRRTRPRDAEPVAGPIGETFPGSPAVRVGFIRHAPVRESSGIAASRKHPGVYWTHNDKGNAPMLYAISREGTLLAEYHVAATHDDWEDVAADEHGNLYVGNIGNNDAARDWLEVHRIPEPDPSAGEPGGSYSLKVERTWRLRFPGEPFDCESLFVRGAHGYVISKVFDGAPATVYRFPLDADGDARLEPVATLPTRGPVTAADLSPDGASLAVLTYGELLVFSVGGDVDRAGDVEPKRAATPSGKLEGVCITADGIVATAEGRDVYLIPAP
jgi:hypothetical protein